MSIAERPRPRLDQSGSTLVEVLVATLVFTAGLIAMAELIAIATSSNVRARRSTLAAILAARKMEELRSLTWGFDLNGAPAGDPSLQPAPWALHRNTPGFVDHVDQSGAIVGREAEPPPGAAYTRRWSIEPLVASPGDALLIQVLVTQAGRRVVEDGEAAGQFVGDARLVTMKVRKAP